MRVAQALIVEERPNLVCKELKQELGRQDADFWSSSLAKYSRMRATAAAFSSFSNTIFFIPAPA
jgi:hypothetical protein